MGSSTKRIKTYKTDFTGGKFIGKAYHETEKINGTFAWAWQQWFSGNLFEPIEKNIPRSELIEDGDAFCGLCRILPDGSCEYWIGMVAPGDVTVPDGYDSFPLPACSMITNWVLGKEPDVYFHCCLADMESMGYHWDAAPNGEKLMMERYVCPRFTQSDENGDLILDLVYFTEYK